MRSLSISYGAMNAHAIGFIMKEALRRAMGVIHSQRLTFEATGKETSYAPGKPDFFTTADTAAQVVLLKVLCEAFPTFGIVAEESELRIPSTHPKHDVWFTIDPLDGTKAFIRGQSHGIGSMISLVIDGKVVAAFVGDPLTGEIYGYRPESSHVHRITDIGHRVLTIDPERKLANQYLLLRDNVAFHSRAIEHFAGSRRHSGLFHGIEITGGSIGISMARLWKGEVGAAVLRPGPQTPWDFCPILGISEKMGFVFIEVTEHSLISERVFQAVPTVMQTDSEIIVIHESRLGELIDWNARKVRREKR